MLSCNFNAKNIDQLSINTFCQLFKTNHIYKWQLYIGNSF